ncbi:efflux transporter outer membrane subunit [Sphingomonas morindae]|uniref:Efflux transporter outer membrane subunit n=1 Tax=Sphingomonas morindae TaxID=1541170 RepID=A0ABY4X3U6_9SPHN|nr:efflux transporter outer membrane subunit [Sphingomonas morindae]USI71559.1 efflux transporter outer membrane subunit [Sphingomonas morindae]
MSKASPLRVCAPLASAAALLAGCTVGPDFERPVVATPTAFFRVDTTTAPSRPAASPIVTDWWTLFRDPVLTSLEGRLSEANLGLKAATARLLQSRAQRRIAGAREYPSAGAAGSYYRERASSNGILSLMGTRPAASQPQSAAGTTPFGVASLPGADGSPPYDLFQAGLDASWELDLWGRTRRSIEAADASLQESLEDRRALLLSAQAELARDYIDLRATQTLLAITRHNRDVARDSVKLTRLRLIQGVTTNLDVADAEAQVATVDAQVPTLEARRDALMNALGLLLAEQPGALAGELAKASDMPILPARVPVGLPSDLARRRPDIRRAEAELHRATASIGVAKADFFPSISLTGSFGTQSLALSNLGSWASHQFVVGPSISLPFFEGGRLKGTLALRTAEQQEAAILFQQTVLKAWYEIDDAFTAYDAEQRRRDRLAEAVRQNRIALAVAQRRYTEGATDFLNVLTIQRALLEAESGLATSSGQAAGNLIALLKALGGGWETTFPDTRLPGNTSNSKGTGS